MTGRQGLRKAFLAALVLACFVALEWAGPLATGLPGGPPTLADWAALQPRPLAADGREIPFSATPYFEKYHPECFAAGPDGMADVVAHPAPGTPHPDFPEGGAGGRWAPVLRVSGTHCNLYVDSAESPQPNDTTCINITTQFDDVIWPVVTFVFGAPGYSVIDIYIYPIDGPGSVGGYYAGGNNLYADSDDMGWMLEILAHEFQHLIHNSRDSTENSWVNEGCADLAIQLCYGFFNNTTSLNSHISYFEAYPDNDLTAFNGQLYDYGSAYAFLSYFHEHFGGNATIKALVADPADGIQGFDNRLAGSGQTFASVFRNWTIASYLNNESIGGAFGYTNLSVKVGAYQVAAYPFSRNTTVNRWAADCHAFAAEGADLELSFDGQDTAPLEVWLGKVGMGAVPSSVERLALDSARDGNIGVPRLGIDYSEVVMVTLATTAGGSYCFTADAIDRTPPVTAVNITPAIPDTPDGWYTRPPSLGLYCNERRATTYYRWDDGNDTEYSGRMEAPEGAHILRFHSRDLAGNFEAEQSVAVRVDTTPPVTNFSVAPPDGRSGWYVTAPDIGLGSEDGATTFYRLGGRDETRYLGPFRPPEGYSSLAYHSVDRHGNVEANRSADFRLDTRKPASAVLTDPAAPDGEDGWFLRPPVIRLETESGSEISCSWDGEPEFQYILPLLAVEGRHELAWHAVDPAGNREEDRTLSVRTDGTAPSCAAALSPDSPDGSNGYYRSNVTVTLVADADSTALYRWNAGAWRNYTGPIAAPEGSSTLYYYAVDGAGNRAQDRSLDLAVDTVPPVTSLSMEPETAGEWSGETPAVALSTEAGARIFWGLDGGDPRQFAGRMQLPAGRHSLFYYSVDEAGNAEARLNRTYALDLAEPSGTLACGNLTPLEGQNISFDASNSTDRDSGVRGFRFVFGDGTETGWVESPLVSHAYPRAGVYTASLVVRDAVGRESPVVTVTVTASATPPRKKASPPGPTVLERLWPFLPYIALALAAAVAGAAMATRRRRGSAGPPGSQYARRD